MYGSAARKATHCKRDWFDIDSDISRQRRAGIQRYSVITRKSYGGVDCVSYRLDKLSVDEAHKGRRWAWAPRVEALGGMRRGVKGNETRPKSRLLI